MNVLSAQFADFAGRFVGERCKRGQDGGRQVGRGGGRTYQGFPISRGGESTSCGEFKFQH